MIVVIGGAYQGKREWALETLGCAPEEIVGHVERIIRAWMDEGKEPEREIIEMAEQWRDAVLLLEDISCGVVPMDAADRAWREAVGRCGAYLARRADRVVRVFCGIGTVIKGA